IVAVTSKNSAADIATAIENGAVGYITKQDSDLHDVGNYIRILRAHGSPISPTAARVLVDAVRRKPAVKPVVSVAASRPAVANPLSPRETEVLNLLARGMSFAEISSVLNISCHTVTAHIKKIYRKLQVHSRGEAVYEAAQLGILPAM
ncbi:MAG TPA: DNA-binding response regulator, partial [Parasutterella excrementihominis]